MLRFNIDSPDVIMINETGAWVADKGRVSIAGGKVVIASGGPVYGVQLIYKTAFEKGARFFGDAWERAYGDLEWRCMVAERLLPWYMHIDESGVQSFIGVMTQPAAFVGFRAAKNSVTVDIDLRSGSGPVDLSDRSLTACTIVAEFCREGISAFAFQREMLRKLCPVSNLASKPVYGGNNWYYAYGKSSREEMIADAKFISRLSGNAENRPYMVIDDGWQKHSLKQGGGCMGGPWVGNEKFGDMATLADEMKASGVIPGIWIRPLYMAEKPDDAWITGQTSSNWYIDPSRADVKEHVASIVRYMTDCGYRLIKHDFSTYDIFRKWGFEVRGRRMPEGCSMYDNTRTNAEIILDLYRTISDAAGDSIIIGCNTVSHLAAGIFQIQRTGDDTSGLNWERTRYMGLNTLAMRMPQHRIFYDSDADCSPITPDVDWSLAKKWLDVLSRSGTPLFVSARPGMMTAEQENTISEAFARAAVNVTPAEPLDWQDNTAPRIWKCADGIHEYDFDAFYGYDDESAWWR